MGKNHEKKLSAKQTNPQRILLRCLLGIAAHQDWSQLCLLRPHSGFRQDQCGIYNKFQHDSKNQLEKNRQDLYHLNSASFPHCKTVAPDRSQV